jgi:hypothetical protein
MRTSAIAAGRSASSNRHVRLAACARVTSSSIAGSARGVFERPLRRNGERRESDDVLARKRQHFAGRDHDAQLGCAIEPHVDRTPRPALDLLEVVQHEEAPSLACDRVPELGHGIAGTERDIEGLRHGTEDSFERARVGQIAEPDAAGPVAEPRPSVADREPRLAGAANAEEAHEPARRQRPMELGEIVVPPDEGIALRREMARDLLNRHPEVVLPNDTDRLRPVGRRHERRAPADPDLEQLDRLVDSLEAPMPARLDLRPVRRRARIRRDERLAALSDRGHTGGHRLRHAFDLEALRAARDVRGRIRTEDHVAGVDARACGKPEGKECGVVGDRERDGALDLFEQQEESVAAIDLASSELLEELARDRVVLGPQRSGARLAEHRHEPRAVHDVGDNENPPDRCVLHCASRVSPGTRPYCGAAVVAGLKFLLFIACREAKECQCPSSCIIASSGSSTGLGASDATVASRSSFMPESYVFTTKGFSSDFTYAIVSVVAPIVRP